MVEITRLGRKVALLIPKQGIFFLDVLSATSPYSAVRAAWNAAR